MPPMTVGFTQTKFTNATWVLQEHSKRQPYQPWHRSGLPQDRQRSQGCDLSGEMTYLPPQPWQIAEAPLRPVNHSHFGQGIWQLCTLKSPRSVATTRRTAFLLIRSRSSTNACPDRRAVRRYRFVPLDYERLSWIQVQSQSGLTPSQSWIARQSGIRPRWLAPP